MLNIEYEVQAHRQHMELRAAQERRVREALRRSHKPSQAQPLKRLFATVFTTIARTI